MMNMLLKYLFLFQLCHRIVCYRVLEPDGKTISGDYFVPYQKGFVGNYEDPTTLQRERVNEGAIDTPTQELLYEGDGGESHQQCPGMVGPFSDGNFYCTAREYGYCDRRSGACFCSLGYTGIDCSNCASTHFMVGITCYPKKLCPNDCSGAGSCNYWDGVCTCFPHRTGYDCGVKLCSLHDDLCETCTDEECLSCKGGYYIASNSTRICRSCYDFDPRCAGCTEQLRCTVCADPILTSVRRSGYRRSDPRLPLEEDTREMSIAIPFGSKSPESFASAESFIVGTTPENPLKDSSIACTQGNQNDETWECESFPATHEVCGHNGVFMFTYPNYVVKETDRFLQLSVRRSGGGLGHILVNYFIKHFTTNDSDVSPTAPYTTIQQLEFEPGVVQRTFLINILDDNIAEENEVFQVVLETPEGGGSVDAQFRTNVTIVDDDLEKLSVAFTNPTANETSAVAGETFYSSIEAGIGTGERMFMGGEKFVAIVENYQGRWQAPGYSNRTLKDANMQRHAKRTVCVVSDLGNGTYGIEGSIVEQGFYDLRIWHLFPNGLKGEYYYDAFMERLAISKFDRLVNFTWGDGKLIPFGTDYISIRWSGVITPDTSDFYHLYVDADDIARLWINDDLILNHDNQQQVYQEPTRPFYMEVGVFYEVILEYIEVTGEAHCRLMWGTDPDKLEAIPPENLFSLHEINESPIQVQITSTNTTATTTECTGFGLSSGIVSQRSVFTFCPRDEYRNMRDDVDLFFLATEFFSSTATLVDSQDRGGVGSEILTVELTYMEEDHCFEGVYTPSRAGEYRLEVLYRSTDYTDDPVHVLGSPFTVMVEVDKANGPYSRVYDLSTTTLSLEAGDCHNFTIVSRDTNRNLRFIGGDTYEVYMYQVDYFKNYAGVPLEAVGNLGGDPTSQPSGSPSSAPTALRNSSFFTSSPALDSVEHIIRYGVVSDMHNGNYSVEICPVIAGVHEIHILLNGVGVSNEPVRIMDRWNSMQDLHMGETTYKGHHVHNSPYTLSVRHATPHPFSSTAEGPGLTEATVGIPISFMVTARDAWDNVMMDLPLYGTPTFPVSAFLLPSPEADVTVWDYKNGSFNIEYTAVVSGANKLSVLINGEHIKHSPFVVDVTDGRTSSAYSYVTGAGLIGGTAGVTSYFQLFSFDFQGNRKSFNEDTYTFVVSGSNDIHGVLEPCPVDATEVATHPICDPTDTFLGHFWAQFVPITKGLIYIDVYLNNTGVATHISNATLTALILPAEPVVAKTSIQGDLYDMTAGVTGIITLQLWDNFENRVDLGGHAMELAQLTVSDHWGTVTSWDSPAQIQDFYYYYGFNNNTVGLPRFYGNWIDYQDGTFSVSYNVELVGQYVTRLAMALPGLNVTYFNTTDFGHLISNAGNNRILQGRPVNNMNAISWTGDIGSSPGTNGSRGEGTYYDMFKTRIESNIAMDLRPSVANREIGYMDETHTAFTRAEKFRSQFWSARWIGLVTPEYAELYNFTVLSDSNSQISLYIGGVGNGNMNATFLQAKDDNLILSANETNEAKGQYNFSDAKSREIMLEYVHYSESDSNVVLMWESPSTPLAVVPSTAFRHWENVSHYNTTIHPAPLCSSCSTAFGEGLHNATVSTKAFFLVYGRDSFGNLLQRGGDVPSMVAVGPNGVAFRGEVTDYGNSTYLVEYYPTASGIFRMYVTIGCCPPHPNVGLPAELDMFKDLLIEGAPFTVDISPSHVLPSKSTAYGTGLFGGEVGLHHSFSIQFRDIHNNPTVSSTLHNITSIAVVFTSTTEGTTIAPSSVVYTLMHPAHENAANAEVTYNITLAGDYDMNVYLLSPTYVDGSDTESNNETQITTKLLGSPFRIVMYPGRAVAEHSVCRGLGLRSGSIAFPSSFEIQLRDSFLNPLVFGGNNFHMRLFGGESTLAKGFVDIIPTCTDLQNGRYLCSYTPLLNGSHELRISLLNYSHTQRGGLGLTGSYFAAPQPLGKFGAPRINEDTTLLPILTRIDPTVSFSWPDGFVFSTINPTLVPDVATLPITSAVEAGREQLGVGRSIRWDGYIMVPKTDKYKFNAWTKNWNVTVTIEGNVVFDSHNTNHSAPYTAANTDSLSLPLKGNAVYSILIQAYGSAATYAMASSISLLWANPVARSGGSDQWGPVPQYFLYDSTDVIAYSPFPVVIT